MTWLDWLAIAYVAFGLATAEFMYRAGVNWLGQLIGGCAWPLYWGVAFMAAWRNR